MGISCALTWTTIHKGCSSTDQGGGKRWAGIRRSVHNGVTISAFNFDRDGEDTMRIFGYLGFLIVWLLAPAPMAITVADTASVQAVAPDGTQPHLAGEDEDLLNIWD
jgi:hypothetical protein